MKNRKLSVSEWPVKLPFIDNQHLIVGIEHKFGRQKVKLSLMFLILKDNTPLHRAPQDGSRRN